MNIFHKILFLYYCFLIISCTESPVIQKPIQPSLSQHKKIVLSAPKKIKPIINKVSPPPPKIKAQGIPQFILLPKKISRSLRRLKINEKGISVYIQELAPSKSPLLAFNADIPRNPASVMKVITTYAALGILRADYRWALDLYTTGEIKNGILYGDLILKGYGYPDFKINDLRRLLQGLRQKGVHKIAGNLVLDNTHFAPNIAKPGDFDGKRYEDYNALPDALLFNERISEFVVRPHKGTIKITSLYPAKNVRIINRLTLKKVKCRGRYASPPMRVKTVGKQIQVIFKGSLSSTCGDRHYKVVITEPVNMLYSTLRQLWITEMGGSFSHDDLVIAKMPRKAQLLYRLKTKSVREILPLINKKSNNVMAKQLFLSIAAQKNIPATTRQGLHKIQQWFISQGLNFPELYIENGSGLSRVGQISARHVGELLIDAYQSPHRDTLLRSLPIMGVDGTLKRRMRGSIAANNSYMKTGTLRNSRAIAGYVKANNGKMYVVVILHNGRGAKSRVLAVHNQLIAWTAKRPLQTISTERVKD